MVRVAVTAALSLVILFAVTTVAPAKTAAPHNDYGDNQLYTISCAPTAAHCVAIGRNGAGKVVVEATNFSSWTSTPITVLPSLGTVLINGKRPFAIRWIPRQIACASATRCVVALTGQSKTSAALIVTSDGGSSWRLALVVPKDDFESVACPSTKLCYLVDDGPEVALGKGTLRVTIWRSSDSGQRWAKAATTEVKGGADIGSMTCPSVKRCLIVGGEASGGNAPVTQPVLISTTNGWRTWSASGTPPLLASGTAGMSGKQLLTEGIYSIACPSISFCAAAGNIFYSDAPIVDVQLAVTVNGHLSWSQHVVTQADDGVVSCSSAEHCTVALASGSANWLFELNAAAGIWTPISTAVPASLNGGASVSCNRIGVCAALGGSTALLFSRDAGNTWGSQPLPSGYQSRGTEATTTTGS